MLDNFEPEGLKETAAQLKGQFPHLLIEASGGITPETLGLYVSPHVDIVSQGKLTQGTTMLSSCIGRFVKALELHDTDRLGVLFASRSLPSCVQATASSISR